MMAKYYLAGDSPLFHEKFILFMLSQQSSELGAEPEMYGVENSSIATQTKKSKQERNQQKTTNFLQLDMKG